MVNQFDLLAQLLIVLSSYYHFSNYPEVNMKPKKSLITRLIFIEKVTDNKHLQHLLMCKP